MSEKQHQRQVFMEKRARALAAMLLTRRADLQIEEVQDDIGLDYLVRFHTTGKDGLRELGIRLRAARAAAAKEQADQLLRPAVEQLRRYGPFLCPVCLFLFTMENDSAWYTWVVEPVDTADGKPRLRVCDEPNCRVLDKTGLKEILQRVDWWYDAAFPSLIVNGPGESGAPRKKAKP
jgi:hypothetical protein